MVQIQISSKINWLVFLACTPENALTTNVKVAGKRKG